MTEIRTFENYMGRFADLQGNFTDLFDQLRDLQENAVSSGAFASLVQRIQDLEMSMGVEIASSGSEDSGSDESHTGYTDADDWPSEAWDDDPYFDE